MQRAELEEGVGRRCRVGAGGMELLFDIDVGSRCGSRRSIPGTCTETRKEADCRCGIHGTEIWLGTCTSARRSQRGKENARRTCCPVEMEGCPTVCDFVAKSMRVRIAVDEEVGEEG